MSASRHQSVGAKLKSEKNRYLWRGARHKGRSAYKPLIVITSLEPGYNSVIIKRHNSIKMKVSSPIINRASLISLNTYRGCLKYLKIAGMLGTGVCSLGVILQLIVIAGIVTDSYPPTTDATVRQKEHVLSFRTALTRSVYSIDQNAQRKLW